MAGQGLRDTWTETCDVAVTVCVAAYKYLVGTIIAILIVAASFRNCSHNGENNDDNGNIDIDGRNICRVDTKGVGFSFFLLQGTLVPIFAVVPFQFTSN